MSDESGDYRRAIEDTGGDANEALLSQHLQLEQRLKDLGSDPADEPEEGRDELEGYELLEELHRGGQGVVYRALQHSTHREVAVKLLLGGAHSSPRRLRRFEREIELVATLDHPNIATVHDSGVTRAGRPYFVMEFIQGEPLDARHRRAGAADEAGTRELIELFMGACSAVHYAHQRGVLHRDLKPGNILVDGARHAHVLDFGLAVPTDQAVAGASRLTRTGEFMGTLAYASPEHVCGIPEEIDVRSDVYSLGVILYELLTGELPYPVDVPVLDVVRNVQSATPRSLTALRRDRSRSGGLDRALAGVDRDLDTILQQALAKEKRWRYQTAGELVEDLERYLAGQPILARGASTWYVLRKALIRHRTGSLVALGVLVALVSATIISVGAWSRARSAAQEAGAQAARAEEIVSYLQRIFWAVSPDQARGRAVTVREVLDQAGVMLAQSSFDSPAAEFELRVTVAHAYASLALPEEAAEQFAAADPLAAQVFGPASPERADVLVGWGRVLTELAEYPRAIEFTRLALTSLQPQLQEHAFLRGQAHVSLARAQALCGEIDAAERDHEQAVAAYSQAFGPESMQVAELYGTQARLLLLRGQFARAEALAQTAHDRWQERDPGGTGAAKAVRMQATIAWVRGDLPVARERQARALQLLRRLYGQGNERLLLLRSELAIVDADLRGVDATRPEIEALFGEKPDRGERTQYAAETLRNLGRLAEMCADYDRAEQLLGEAIAVYAQIFSVPTLASSTAIAQRGWVLLRLGRLEEARALALEAVRNVQRFGAEGTPYEATFRLQLGWALLRTGDVSGAVEQGRVALGVREAYYAPEHPMVIDARADLGMFLYLAGDYRESETILRRARELHEQHHSAPTSTYSRVLHVLGELLRDQSRFGEAGELIERGLVLRRQLLPARHPDLADSLHAWAMFRYYSGQRGADIAQDWHEALAIYETHGDPRAAWVCSSLGAWTADVDQDEVGAREWIDRAIALGTGTEVERHPLWGTVVANRGMMYLRAGDSDTGIEFLERAWESLRETSPGHLTTRGVLERLIDACQRDGRTERAAQLQPFLVQDGEH